MVGALVAAAVGVLWPQIPLPLAPVVAIAMAILSSAAWGAAAGWLKARRGAHEVIVTIMLNFIAAGLTGWFALKVIPNPLSQNPETALIGSNYHLKPYDLTAQFFPDTTVNFSLWIAIGLALCLWIFLWKTKYGFEFRLTGYNAEAAERAGVKVKTVQVLALAMAGAFAGFVACSEVIGGAGQFRIGFSPDYGFIGIAVALLAQNNPLAIIPAAFLMAALHKGASDLDLETASITRDFSKVIQAAIILGVSAQGFWQWKKRKEP